MTVLFWRNINVKKIVLYSYWSAEWFWMR